MATDSEPLMVELPARVYASGDKQPRPRCGICGGPTVSATIDRGKTEKVKKKKAGRPKKGSKFTRYRVIGRWCVRCGIFYYPNRSPNYRLRHAV